MLHVHIKPDEAGVAVAENGNPLITGLDKRSGIMVSIEVDSGNWKAFASACQRLSVSGIRAATMDDIIGVQQNGG